MVVVELTDDEFRLMFASVKYVFNVMPTDHWDKLKIAKLNEKLETINAVRKSSNKVN